MDHMGEKVGGGAKRQGDGKGRRRPEGIMKGG